MPVRLRLYPPRPILSNFERSVSLFPLYRIKVDITHITELLGKERHSHLSVGPSVGWLVGWLVGWSVGWLVGWSVVWSLDGVTWLFLTH